MCIRDRPKSWVGNDLQVMIQNSQSMVGTDGSASSTTGTTTTTKRSALPYQMLDTFANRPEGRRIKIVPKEY